jgi:hypothetical protein
MTAMQEPTIKLTANDLRALAEAADGLRDEDAVVIVDPEVAPGGPRYKIVRESQRGDAQPVLRLRTDNKPPFVKRKPELVLMSDPPVSLSSHPNLTLAHCDAVFTSISAVDKFVLPYYERMRELSAVQAAREKFAADSSALAVVHLPHSVDDTLRATGSMYAVVAPARKAPAKKARAAADALQPEAMGAPEGFVLRDFIGDFIGR